MPLESLLSRPSATLIDILIFRRSLVKPKTHGRKQLSIGSSLAIRKKETPTATVISSKNVLMKVKTASVTVESTTDVRLEPIMERSQPLKTCSSSITSMHQFRLALNVTMFFSRMLPLMCRSNASVSGMLSCHPSSKLRRAMIQSISARDRLFTFQELMPRAKTFFLILL